MNDKTINQLIDMYKEKVTFASIQHPIMQKIKSIQRNSSQDSERLLVAEGIWAHQKLLKTNLNIICLVICLESIYSNDGLELTERLILKAQRILVVSKKIFEKISNREEPDGFASLTQIPDFDIDKLKVKDNALILVLDSLENPGNIGTILRTCDGAGVDAVIICNRKTRITNPKLVKGSMGAVFTLPIVEFVDAEHCAKWLTDNNFAIYLADTRAEKSYKNYDYMGKTALVMGSERHGISNEWFEQHNNLLSIPMMGICDSLNVGVAASIITYEVSMIRKQNGCGKMII